MIPIKRVGLLAGAASLTLTGGSFADTTTQETNEQLKARVSELESRLAAVESANSEDWLTEQRADEIKGLVQDVLADADTRSSMLSQGVTAGYDDGFIISSADGNWLLRTNFYMQQRFIWDYADTAAGNGLDGAPTPRKSVWGFENTRSKFILSGNIISPEWFYLIDINVGTNLGGATAGSPIAGLPGDARVGVGNAYAGYDYGNGWSVKVGQFKDDYVREDAVDARYQLAVERSNSSYLFTTGYTQGIQVEYQADQFRVVGSINDGARTGALVADAVDTTFAFTARGEYLAMGTWDQFMDFTSPSGEEMGVMAGVGFHYEKFQAGIPGSAALWLGLTGDCQVEFGGANLFGSISYAYVDNVGFSDQNMVGIVLQGGYYFTDMWEGFGRYEFSYLNQAVVPAQNLLTFGVNGYLSGHNAKWTTDFGIAFTELKGSPTGGSNVAGITGWRTDLAGASTQFVVRSQLQIAF